MNKFVKQLSVITILITFILTGKTFGGERIPLPEGVFIYKSASEVFGYEAAWNNPAGLGGFTGSGLMLMADYFDGDIAKSYGGLLNGQQSALAYRKIDNPAGSDIEEWVLASGLGMGQLHIGGSYRFFKSGPEFYENRHFWNFGLQMRGQYRLSAAAVFSNINRSKLNGERTEVEHRYSVSYRPFDFDLTVSVDMFRTSSINIGDADLAYSATFSPYPGLIISGYLDSDENFNIGVRANLTKYFVGGETRLSSGGGERGTTFYVGTTDLRQESLMPWPNKRLSVDVPGRMSENPPNPVFGRQALSFYRLISSIYRAADDEAIEEIVIKLRNPSIRFAQAQELRDALKYFKNSNKTVVCHLSMPNNVGYYIASVTDSILIPPVSQLNLVGLKAELTYYGQTVSKIGAQLDFVQIGDYKSAAERYTQKESSEETRQQINRLLDDIYAQFVSGIAEGRNISEDSVRKIIDIGPFTSAEAMKYGLVDGLSYADEVKKNFLSDLPEISLRSYEKDTLLNDGWPAKPKIAVIVAEGAIDYSKGGYMPFDDGETVAPSSMGRAFARAEKDNDVKAIVFRVDSPGGFALAAEEILHSANKTAKKKPIIVSMGNVAASGGYFISMAADKLYADAGTITGSIGIYGGKLSLEKLYEKIELGKELYTRGKFSGMMSSIRPFTDEEREKYRSQLYSFYEYFTGLVSENRKLPADSIEQLSQGKVWTGREALNNGLIDEVGGLKQALDYTASRLNLKEYELVVYPEKRPLFLLPGNSLMSAMASILGLGKSEQSVVNTSQELLDEDGIFTRMPFDIFIE